MNYAVILAGGTGTRFWPFSRELEPKQFMRLVDKMSLLESTIKRVRGVIIPENTFIITNRSYLYEVKKHIEKSLIPPENIILEPQGKNTAPAVGLCAKLISAKDRDAVLVVLPSDHYIKGEGEFRNCLRKAIIFAKKGFLVTIGIRPKNPSTGYGYIKVKAGLRLKPGCFRVDKFLEKPDLNKAKVYLRHKEYFWNSGMFIWGAGAFLEEVRLYLPKLYRSLMKINSMGDLEKTWKEIKPISVDYGIMEHSKSIVLLPARFYWTDLGSWGTLDEVLPKDKRGNVFQADSLDLGSRNTSIFSRGNRLISTIGLNDLVIADTPDALLICDRHKTQDVKKVVECLKLSKRKECVTHLTEKRPWGAFTILQVGQGFKIKLIEIDPKKRLSLQSHKSRAEHWIVVSGCAKVTKGKKTIWVENNSSIYVPRGTRHRLENPKSMPLIIVEVQTGTYLEEDDIQRYSDDFQR